VKEHPEDRKLRLEAIAEAKETIGPFWRQHWREFVALVQTYADVEAAEKLEALRVQFWGVLDLPKGPPPTTPAEPVETKR
jgi:hypothetical protein